MKINTLASTDTIGEQRSTAYYYADLEKYRQKDGTQTRTENKAGTKIVEAKNADKFDQAKVQRKCVEGEIPRKPGTKTVEQRARGTNSVENPIPEQSETIRPHNFTESFRLHELKSPEYSTPEGGKRFPSEVYSTPDPGKRFPEETYSTAGTIPLPREKEPLLAELEIVGRLPLTQLDSNSVRRSRSWYLCCPTIEEDISRESSWRYSSLRTVTAPPLPKRVSSLDEPQSLEALRAERDNLLLALRVIQRRESYTARIHDARLAELHGVIAELVRGQGRGQAILEESDETDECESVTQPAGEVDNDADESEVEPNDTSSLSAALDNTHESRVEDAHCMRTDTQSESTLPGSCERDHGSIEEGKMVTVCPSPGRLESREAKLASRVKLRKIGESSDEDIDTDASWCFEPASSLPYGLRTRTEPREEAIVNSKNVSFLRATVNYLNVKNKRLEADNKVLECSLARAVENVIRVGRACALHESTAVSVCEALRSADRALETYDVLLALAQTNHSPTDTQRTTAEQVARQLLNRLESPHRDDSTSLLSPGPWLTHDSSPCPLGVWTESDEELLRRHAARLKADTVRLRRTQHQPTLNAFSSKEYENPDADLETFEAAIKQQEECVEAELRSKEEFLAILDKQNETMSKSRRKRSEAKTPSHTDL